MSEELKVNIIFYKKKDSLMRKKIIFGNWKMNMDAGLAMDYITALKDLVGSTDSVEMGVCPPDVYLAMMSSMFQGSRIVVGAQNMYFEEKGAFTGQTAAYMLRDLDIEWVILGHSETRHTIGNLDGNPDFVGETDALINKKVHAALNGGLNAILCVGEMLHEREAGKTNEINRTQLTEGLKGICAEQMGKIVIAYEPVWAIGTGKTASPEQAQKIHLFIRNLIADKYGKEIADNISILYGGSVKPNNAKEIFNKPDVDGGLIGGAALKANDFKEIINAF
jgi:triosephosphate isomerase